MSTTTKKDLIDRIAAVTKQKRVDVKETVQTFLNLIVEEVRKGNRLEFRDFGVFEIKDRAARTAQNPKTLERVTVPAKRTVKFKSGRLMRDALKAPSAAEAGNGQRPKLKLDGVEVQVAGRARTKIGV